MKLKKLICKHRWIQPEIYRRYDVINFLGASETKYVVCRKCGKESFVKSSKVENLKESG